MADPNLGNRATEQGEFEQGKDFQGIGVSRLPEPGPVLDVEVKMDGSDLLLSIERSRPKARSLELRHSDTDMLAAQLLDDPEMTSFQIRNVGAGEAAPFWLSKAIARNQNREQLIWFGIDSANMSAALGDRIIVRRDAL